MPRLFVDCDDTLVIWDDSARQVNQDKELWVREKWKLDVGLIGDINCWLDQHPEYSLVVWSGGGVNYAADWAERAFPHRPYMVASKDMRIPTDLDICIDDMPVEPRDKRVQVYGPDISSCPICRA